MALSSIRSDEGLTLETASALEYLYGGQITRLSYQVS